MIYVDIIVDLHELPCTNYYGKSNYRQNRNYCTGNTAILFGVKLQLIYEIWTFYWM